MLPHGGEYFSGLCVKHRTEADDSKHQTPCFDTALQRAAGATGRLRLSYK